MLVSIVIPAYNTEKYIRECIESCFRQTYSQIEIICVNDGSKDNTRKIIDSMLSEDNRLRVLHQENAGVTAARMAGTKAAQGHYIFYLDSDDVLTDHCIATLIQNSDDGTVDMVTGRCLLVSNNQFISTPSKESPNRTFFSGADCFIEVLRLGNPSLCPRLHKRILCLQTNIPFSIKWSEDYAMLVQIIAQCKKTVYTDELVYFVRCNPESVTARSDKNAFLSQKDALASIAKTVNEYPEKKKIIKFWYARELIWELHSLWASTTRGIIDYKCELHKKIFTNLILHPSVARCIIMDPHEKLLIPLLISLISPRLAVKIINYLRRHCW